MSNLESLETKKFVDFYNFLGIPPSSPPNLIYLAILKLESSDWNNLGDMLQKENFAIDMERKFAMVKDRLLSTISKRQAYDQEWGSYYYPLCEQQTNVIEFSKRSQETSLLTIGLRQKTEAQEEKPKDYDFDYKSDFFYFMMRDFPGEGDIFFLNTEEKIPLLPSEDVLFFENKQFHLRTFSKNKIRITNDAMGKLILSDEKDVIIPLHIGDRIEFSNGTRLILRTMHSGKIDASNPDNQPYYLNLLRENISLELKPEKIYIVGRSTNDIRNIEFDEENFCFINLGRRERSISRQNFQIFHSYGQWYIQDLGSRYGTTLDFRKHPRMETLIGGAIMLLEEGIIRLGYDKSYPVEISNEPKRPQIIELPSTKDIAPEYTVYDISLLL
ncbi:MAG: FHA domain-containing protein [Candidatus Brocadiae bacterium]|nr:FHA domain-containing protein [Candidatus Brocadiia bacterium]